MEAKRWTSGVKWLGLKIVKATKPKDGRGMVEFVARYKQDGEIQKMRECSQFKLVDEQWLYELVG